MRTDFIELARICLAHSHVTASPEVAAELRRIAEEYRKKAADLEWENWLASALLAIANNLPLMLAKPLRPQNLRDFP